MEINLAQQVFTLFYAIAWGTAANSQPRWSAFSYAAICMKEGGKVALRVSLSWILLNIAPICYFVLVLGTLNKACWNVELYPWSASIYWRIVVAVVAAFAPFGFYKFWMGLVQVAHEHCFSLSEIAGLQEMPQYKGRAFAGGVPNMVSGFLIILALGFVVCMLS